MHASTITLKTLQYSCLYSCFLTWTLSSWREDALFIMMSLCLAGPWPVFAAQNMFISNSHLELAL